LNAATTDISHPEEVLVLLYKYPARICY